MEIKLLDLLSRTAGIGGICLGILLIILSKILHRNIIGIFSKRTAAIIIILSISSTFLVGILGLLVYFNSDMRSLNLDAKSKSDESPINTQVSSSFNQQATLYKDNENDSNTKTNEKLADAKSSVNNKNAYESFTTMTSKTEVKAEKTKNSSKAQGIVYASSFSLSFLNIAFTISFTLFTVLTIFIFSCIFYNKKFLSEIEEK